ncbi:ATP-grasp domain-containing protein [Winogradskyella sp.]|uniref:ATP-grasp domain-containing protein n=1 Tax=Winogradskyella sp. TaxID=1883156 RepID=UPI003F6B1015
MTKYDVVILTDKKQAYPSTIDNYVKNVITEDALVANALGKLGLNVIRLAWSDPNFDWSTTKAVMFRTTWDYFDDFKKFSEWLNKVSKLTTLINSETLIRWNLDKHYLLDLQNKGIHIAETKFVETGDTRTLEALHAETEWKDTVLKPCISGAARHTYKLNADNIAQHEVLFKELIAQEAMMLQPFQHNIVSKGEVSMMVCNGQFTHAILKKAKAGDFRVQDDFGGSVHDYTPTEEEISFAVQCVNACDEMPLYARVDIFNDNQGRIALAELEIIEPELWFRNFPEAAEILAKATKEKLSLL